MIAIPPFVQFLIATVVWGTLAALILHLRIVHPIAVFIVWIVGFVWITGYIASGPRDADQLLKSWLGTLLVISALGALFALFVASIT